MTAKELAEMSRATLQFQKLARQTLAEPADGIDAELRSTMRARVIEQPSQTDMKTAIARAKELIERQEKRDVEKAKLLKEIEGGKARKN
jgi:hypothetical protein